MSQFSYRKKPVEIEAFEHRSDAGEHTTAYPRWLINAIVDGTIYTVGPDTFIKTLEGDHKVSEGDFIVKGVKGELYPVKPDIFRLTYDKV